MEQNEKMKSTAGDARPGLTRPFPLGPRVPGSLGPGVPGSRGPLEGGPGESRARESPLEASAFSSSSSSSSSPPRLRRFRAPTADRPLGSCCVQRLHKEPRHRARAEHQRWCPPQGAMKYLEDPRLALLTNKLCGCEVGNLVLDGRIEAFSCTLSGSSAGARACRRDLTLLIEFQARGRAMIRSSPRCWSSSSSRSSRRLRGRSPPLPLGPCRRAPRGRSSSTSSSR